MNFWEKKFQPCKNCSDGFIFEKGMATKCSCRKTYEEETNYIFNVFSANLITKKSTEASFTFLRDYSLSNYKGEDKSKNLIKIQKYISSFKNRYSSLNLFFQGKPGTQKTCLAKYILSQLIRQGCSTYYILANSLIETLQDSARNDEAQALIDHFTTVDCLVIDEFSEDKIVTYHSGYQKKFLLPWLKIRLETLKKATIFISNTRIDSIGTFFEGAIQDVILREIPDHEMNFEDVYRELQGDIDLSSIWD